jgi:putative ABC transport system permease protein
VDNGTMFFHFEYLKESLETGAALGPPGVGVYVIGLAPGAVAENVMRDVDALFENGPQRVQTTTEAEFSRQFVSMLGNVPTFIASIGAGVFFAILLAALNTMLMAGRERTRDIGVMKAMGFSDGAVFGLLLAESLFLCTLGGLLGVLLATASEPVLTALFGPMLPGFVISVETKLLALGVTVFVGVVAGLIPAWRARKLVAVDAIRAVI